MRSTDFIIHQPCTVQPKGDVYIYTVSIYFYSNFRENGGGGRRPYPTIYPGSPAPYIHTHTQTVELALLYKPFIASRLFLSSVRISFRVVYINKTSVPILPAAGWMAGQSSDHIVNQSQASQTITTQHKRKIVVDRIERERKKKGNLIQRRGWNLRFL